MTSLGQRPTELIGKLEEAPGWVELDQGYPESLPERQFGKGRGCIPRRVRRLGAHPPPLRSTGPTVIRQGPRVPDQWGCEMSWSSTALSPFTGSGATSVSALAGAPRVDLVRPHARHDALGTAGLPQPRLTRLTSTTSSSSRRSPGHA